MLELFMLNYYFEDRHKYMYLLKRRNIPILLHARICPL